MLNAEQAFSGFAVDDLPKAKAFYGDTLGMDVAEEHGMRAPDELRAARERSQALGRRRDRPLGQERVGDRLVGRAGPEHFQCHGQHVEVDEVHPGRPVGLTVPYAPG